MNFFTSTSVSEIRDTEFHRFPIRVMISFSRETEPSHQISRARIPLRMLRRSKGYDLLFLSCSGDLPDNRLLRLRLHACAPNSAAQKTSRDAVFYM